LIESDNLNAIKKSDKSIEVLYHTAFQGIKPEMLACKAFERIYNNFLRTEGFLNLIHT